MSNDTRTPGPWFDNGNQIEAKSRLHTIICTTGGNGVQYATNGKPDEAKANARLIAAAPELLDELEATNILLLNLIHDWQEKGLECETFKRRWTYNRAAIAKATTGKE